MGERGRHEARPFGGDPFVLGASRTFALMGASPVPTISASPFLVSLLSLRCFCSTLSSLVQYRYDMPYNCQRSWVRCERPAMYLRCTSIQFRSPFMIEQCMHLRHRIDSLPE